jgi:hypothetical protein
MHYELPIIPTDWETYKEGIMGALSVFAVPFILFFFISKVLPVYSDKERQA